MAAPVADGRERAQVISVSSHGAVVHLIGPDHLTAAVGERITSSGAATQLIDADELVQPAAPDATVQVSPARGRCPGEVRRGEERVAAVEDTSELLRIAESEVHLAVATYARAGVFFHAGAVAWDGCGIIVPGRSGAGKTTLVRSLVALGAAYYSDEYAVVDGTGRLHPYPKPLSIRTADAPIRVELPTALHGAGPVPIALVAALRYSPETHGHGAELVVGAAATLPLVDNAVAARLQPTRVLDAAVAVVGSARVLVGNRGDADAAAGHLLDAMATSHPAS